MAENQFIFKASRTKLAHIGFVGIYLADSLVSANMVALTIRSFFSPRM